MKFKLIINLLLIMCMILSMVAFASAILTFEPEEPADVKLSCFSGDSSFCSATAVCNITIFAPNMSLFVNNSQMENNIQYYNTTSLTERGEYNVVVQCIDGVTNGYTSFTFLATDIPQENQGIVAVGILFSIIALAFLFLMLGFKLSQSDTYFPIALFFILISLLLGVYCINLGYQYNRDMLISDMTTSGHFNIYIGVIYGLIAVSIIALLFLTIKTIKEFRERKSMVDNGEYYNPQTQQYR